MFSWAPDETYASENPVCDRGGWHGCRGLTPLQSQHRLVGARRPSARRHPTLQGVYRFDPTLYADLVATPIKGDIPSEILYRLPEWCVYIETPSLTMPDGEAVHGVWAHLEDDHRHGREVRLLVDVESRSWAIPLHLGKWSLQEAIDRTLAVSPVPGGDLFASAAKTQMLQIAAPVLSLLLYLCTQADDVGDGTKRPCRPQPKRTKRGLRLFPAERVRSRAMPRVRQGGAAHQSVPVEHDWTLHQRGLHTNRPSAGRRPRASRVPRRHGFA